MKLMNNLWVPLQFETVWIRELEGKVRGYEPTKAKEHLHIYEGKKFVFPAVEWDHCTASPPRQVQHKFSHLLGQTFTFLPGLEAGEEESHLFVTFTLQTHQQSVLSAFITVLLKQSQLLKQALSQVKPISTHFYPFGEDKKNSFCCCFYNQQLPKNLSFTAIICRAKMFMHIGLVDYL